MSSPHMVGPVDHVSPAIQSWSRAFAYTPQSSAGACAPSRTSSDRHRNGLGRTPRRGDEDALPTVSEWAEGSDGAETEATHVGMARTSEASVGSSRGPCSRRARARKLDNLNTSPSKQLRVRPHTRRLQSRRVLPDAVGAVTDRSRGDTRPHSGMLDARTTAYPSPPTSNAVQDSRSGADIYGYTSLFDDLMIMLKRLKPILVQESVRDDPWKVLIAVRLLNVTTGKAAIPVFCKIMSRWPTPEDLVHAPHIELVELLRPLGLYNKRAHWIKDVSQRFLEDRHASEGSSPSEEMTRCLSYPGVGPYALDSLHIFCAWDEDTWQRVMPRDKELVRYLRWRWAVEQGKVWYPDGMGVIGDVDVPYLMTLVDELAAHYDGTIGGEGYMYHFCDDLCAALGGGGVNGKISFNADVG